MKSKYYNDFKNNPLALELISTIDEVNQYINDLKWVSKRMTEKRTTVETYEHPRIIRSAEKKAEKLIEQLKEFIRIKNPNPKREELIAEARESIRQYKEVSLTLSPANEARKTYGNGDENNAIKVRATVRNKNTLFSPNSMANEARKTYGNGDETNAIKVRATVRNKNRQFSPKYTANEEKKEEVRATVRNKNRQFSPKSTANEEKKEEVRATVRQFSPISRPEPPVEYNENMANRFMKETPPKEQPPPPQEQAQEKAQEQAQEPPNWVKNLERQTPSALPQASAPQTLPQASAPRNTLKNVYEDRKGHWEKKNNGKGWKDKVIGNL
jgi:hypothetical protein